MSDLFGFCGLDCEKCDAYIATVNNDQELRTKTASLWANLNNAPIKPEHINCKGCRNDGAKTYFCSTLCQIRTCAMQKGVATCGRCSLMDTCPLMKDFIATNPSVLQNLRG